MALMDYNLLKKEFDWLTVSLLSYDEGDLKNLFYVPTNENIVIIFIFIFNQKHIFQNIKNQRPSNVFHLSEFVFKQIQYFWVHVKK